MHPIQNAFALERLRSRMGLIQNESNPEHVLDFKALRVWSLECIQTHKHMDIATTRLALSELVKIILQEKKCKLFLKNI